VTRGYVYVRYIDHNGADYRHGQLIMRNVRDKNRTDKGDNDKQREKKFDKKKYRLQKYSNKYKGM